MPYLHPRSIAVVMTSFDPGGTEHQMIELVRRLGRNHWNVHVACLRAQGRWLGRVADAASSLTEFPVRGFRRPDTWRQALAFGRWCRARGVAIVHAADLYANIFALPAAALAGIPRRVGNRRGLNTDRTRGQLALQRAAYACAHTVVANSRAAAVQLRSEGVPDEKVRVIPNGLDLGRFPPRPAGRGPLRRVVVVANLRPEKGHDVLLDAAVEIIGRHPDAHLDFIGDGPLRGALAAKARDLRVDDHVTFHGAREDVPARLAAADIFVLPSRSESFPNAALEAMAAGLPVVASAVGGLVELIDDGRTGLLVPSDDPGALADSVCRVMAEPGLGDRLGEAGRAQAARQYSFERMVTAFEHLYGQVA